MPNGGYTPVDINKILAEVKVQILIHNYITTVYITQKQGILSCRTSYVSNVLIQCQKRIHAVGADA